MDSSDRPALHPHPGFVQYPLGTCHNYVRVLPLHRLDFEAQDGHLRRRGLLEEVDIHQASEELRSLLDIVLPAVHPEGRMRISVRRMGRVAHDAVAYVRVHQIVGGLDHHVVNRLAEQRLVAQIDGETEIRAFGSYLPCHYCGIVSGPDEALLVYGLVKGLQRYYERVLSAQGLRVAAYLAKRIHQALGRTFPRA